MKIKVNPKNYTNLGKYPEYMDNRGNEIPKPKNPKYEAGDVVVTNEDGLGKLRLGVVLGCINSTKGQEELRTDAVGMITFDRIRHANVGDFGKSWVSYQDKLYKECRGFKIKVNWDDYSFTATEPKELQKEK